MKELKPGDRVKLKGYALNKLTEHAFLVEGAVASVSTVHFDEKYISVDLEELQLLVTRSQIKSRLVKRPRREWILQGHGDDGYHIASGPGIDRGISIRVREVRAKKGGV